MKPKIGIFTLPFPMTNEEAVEYVSKMGAGALEPLATPKRPVWDQEGIRRFREKADRLGIVLPCLSLGITLTGENADEAMRRVRECADAARELGIPLLHHTVRLSLCHEEAREPFEKVLTEALPRVREGFDYAADRGVTCVYEEQGFCFNGIERLSLFLDALDRPAKVVLDTGNIGFASQRAPDFARRFANRIVHVHVKDYRVCPYVPGKRGWRLGDEMLTPALPGEGEMGVREAIRILLESGFGGWFMLENEPMENPEEEQKKSVRILRDMLHNI